MLFLDRASPLGKLERTPQGGYVAPARIARTGVMLYSAGQFRAKGAVVPAKFKDTDLVRVYMPAEVLAAAADSLRAAPVTNDHPPELVTPENYRKYTCGNVMADSVAFDGKFLSARMTLQEAGLILDVESGRKQQVSAGYMAETDFVDGVSPEGEPYHAIRRWVEYNHNAVVRAGRAGSAVRLQLDSIEECEEDMSIKLKIRGAEMDANVAQAAIDAADLQLDAMTSERDSLKAELDATKAELATAKSKETLDAAVETELARRAEVKAGEERKAKVAARYPKLDLSKYAQPAIDALHDSISVEDAKDPDGVERLATKTGSVAAPAPQTDAKDKPRVRKLTARDRMLASYRDLSAAVDSDKA